MNRWVIGLSIVLLSLTTQGQDLVFSQYYNAPLMLNPAFTGLTSYPHFSVNYRNQWPSFDQAYISYAASYNQGFDKLNSGIGIQLISDQQADGILSTNSLGLSYSYVLNFDYERNLKFGVSGTFGQTSLDWDRLIFGEGIDVASGEYVLPSGEVRPLNLRNGFFDISAGFLYNTKDWYLGVALFHLNNAGVGFQLNPQNTKGLPIRFSAHTGYQILLKENKNEFPTFIQPMLLVTDQSGFFQVNAGVAAQFDRILAGVFYRHVIQNVDALILTAGYKFEIVEISYSYDITLSQLANVSGGSHEIGMVFDLSSLYPPKSKLNDCLKLFR